jgi:putative hydrolase of the HAD superfamily
VYFDAVGTLLFPDPPAPAVYAEVARQQGLALSTAEVRARFVAAYRAEEEADAGAGWVTSEGRERDRWRSIVTEALAGVSDPHACYEFLYSYFAKPGAWRLAPDAEATLTALHERGLLLGLGSNYDERLWPVLDGFPQLALLLAHVVISAAIGCRKPGAAFFARTVENAGCEACEVLFVGDDRGNDYEGATAAGLPALLLDPAGRYLDVPHRIVRLSELVE